MNGFNDDNTSVHSAEDELALTALLRNTYAAPTEASYWTGLEQRVLSQVRDTQLLQSAYAAPVDDTYWSDLEQRVMARVRDQASWWAVLPEWRAAGMVAAAAALFLVGATTLREQQRDAVTRERAAMAAEARAFDSAIEPVNLAISASGRGVNGRSATPERYIDLIRP